ncbi:MAG: hypothetical protein ABW022_10700 [Actinoplanes sp.]
MASTLLSSDRGDVHAGYSRSLPWHQRPAADELLAEAVRSDRLFDAVVVGVEYERAFTVGQARQIIPYLQAHGITMWLPEADGPIDLDEPAHQALLTLLGHQSEREVLRFRMRTILATQPVATVDRPGRPVDGVRGVAGRDPATGREIWWRDDMNFVWDLGAGRLPLSAAADLASATTVLVDAASGRTIGRPLGGQEAFVDGPAGSLMLLRATRTPYDRTAVNRLDLANGRQTALGTVDRLAEQDCQGVTGYLLCPRKDTVTVTAVG